MLDYLTEYSSDSRLKPGDKIVQNSTLEIWSSQLVTGNFASRLHTPHLHGSLVGNEKGVPDVGFLRLLQRVDPGVATASGRDVLGSDVVAKVPVPRVLFSMRILRWQADDREDANSEEATAVVAPKIFRQVACQGRRGCHGIAGHRGGLIVHRKVDEAPQEVRPMSPGPHESQGLCNAALPGLAGFALLRTQGCQVDTGLVPHAGIKFLQRRALANQMRRP
mmetsp:Transcript_119600/g.168227  ORF Transcript_119600/g.168227 Transcript_119600/m.168227 type:complete len:221 (-) Transcript_119600:1146-1808(-)